MTGLDFEKISNFVQQHGKEHDVLILSPFWDLNSLFANAFEQGDFFHPGLLSCTDKFLQSVGKDLRLSELVMHSDNTAYCNYFIGNKKFWLHWLELGEQLFQSAEAKDTDLAIALNQNMVESQRLLPQKIFVQERLVNMLLAGPEFKSKAWNMFDLPSSATPLSQYKSQAVMANALKLAYAQLNDRVYLQEFHHVRDRVWGESGIGELAKARDEALRDRI